MKAIGAIRFFQDAVVQTADSTQREVHVMKRNQRSNGMLAANLVVVLFAAGAGLGISRDANATPAFARTTGAHCRKCHSASYPRLNWTGERFMRNGFKLPTATEELDISGFPSDDNKDEEAKDSSDETMDLVKDVGDYLSVRGKINPYSKDEGNPDSSLGSTVFFAIFASGQLAPDVPVWAEAETNTATGETEVNNYSIGWTNVLKDQGDASRSLVNFRVGGFTPTEWLSVSDQKRSIDSNSTHPGAYRGKHRFTMVGDSLGTKTGVEYFGYTQDGLGVPFVDDFFWAAGIGDAKGQNRHGAKPDANKEKWFVGRVDINKGSSISFLYMAFEDVNSWTVSGNYRANRDFELRAQYSRDDSGSIALGRGDVYGLTGQADWHFSRDWTGIVRYDMTDNGMDMDAKETQLTAALVYTRWQNIKVTASWVAELKRAGYSNDKLLADQTKADSYSVQVQFAF